MDSQKEQSYEQEIEWENSYTGEGSQSPQSLFMKNHFGPRIYNTVTNPLYL